MQTQMSPEQKELSKSGIAGLFKMGHVYRSRNVVYFQPVGNVGRRDDYYFLYDDRFTVLSNPCYHYHMGADFVRFKVLTQTHRVLDVMVNIGSILDKNINDYIEMIC
jgi:hypothetical protein